MTYSLYLAILFSITILLILFLRFCIFKKLTITYGEFNSSVVVYRSVKGDIQTLQKEQSIFTRRAQSLWGKEMRFWPTFRIMFPKLLNKYAVFGIIVPDSFNCDKECLEELGFELGSLDSLRYVAKIEVPTRFCYSLKLNQYRAWNLFKVMFKKKKIFGEENFAKNKIQNLDKKNEEENFAKKKTQNLDNKKNDEENFEINDDVETDIKETENNNKTENNETTLNEKGEIGNDDNNKKNEANGTNNFGSDESNKNKQNESNDSKKNEEDENKKSESSKTAKSDKNVSMNPEDVKSRIESIKDEPPFAEIRYKKKRKQLFITPLMNDDELIGLWIPLNDESAHSEAE